MASWKLSLLTFLAFSSVLLRSSLQTRTLNSHYQLLDVSDSIQRALDAVSNAQILKPHQKTPYSSSMSDSLLNSSFSVPLYARETVQHTDHKDYKSLLLARLARDGARVRFLGAKLGLLQDQEQTDFEPLDLLKNLSTPIVSGLSQGDGDYFAQIGIGTPPTTAHIDIDTGSDVTWVQCKPCTECYKQTDPIYDPSASSTRQPLTCEAAACKKLSQPLCSAGTCKYMVAYGDGSVTTGDLVTETVSLGSTGTVSNLAIGCGHENDGLFAGSSGILGLGGGAVSFPSQIKARLFSYCLPDRHSSTSSTLDFNSAVPGDSVTTQLTKNAKFDTFYYVSLTGFNVGGKAVQISPSVFQLDPSGQGGIVVDSGSTITHLQSEAYAALRDAFRSQTSNLPSAAGVPPLDTCYDLSSIKGGKVQVPTVALVFEGGKSLPLPAKNYLIPVDTDGTFCFAFVETNQALSILGNVQQQGIRVSYDLANSLAGFSLDKC